jgi:hypothetical protein
VSFKLEIEGWYEHTTFETEVHHPGSGREFQIDLKICTEYAELESNRDHNIVLQLSESSARRLRDKLTAAIHEAYFMHEEEHTGPP